MKAANKAKHSTEVKMIPSKSQWKSWSLPSKYTAASLVVGLFGLFIAIFYPASFFQDSSKIIEGEYELTSLGLHEVNYGYRFKSKPRVEFIDGKNGGIENPERFEIISQSNSGFVVKVDGALSGGTSIKWRASGEN
jgi:hypothetical protein